MMKLLPKVEWFDSFFYAGCCRREEKTICVNVWLLTYKRHNWRVFTLLFHEMLHWIFRHRKIDRLIDRINWKLRTMPEKKRWRIKGAKT